MRPTQNNTNVETKAAGTACFSAPVSYHVTGKQILDNNNNIFIPYGIQMGGPDMASATWQTNNSSYITQSALQQAYTFWHSNTSRLQISSYLSICRYLYPNYNVAYLDRIDQIVKWATQAEQRHLFSPCNTRHPRINRCQPKYSPQFLERHRLPLCE